jgi:hypothetical protein
MTTMIQNLSTDFQAELKAKQDALDVTQAHLRAATRELSDKRKQIQTWQSRCAELDQINQRVRNVEKALSDEDQFDWTGRTDLNGRDARDAVGPAFSYRGTGSTMIGIGGSVDISVNVDSEPPMPGGAAGGDTVAMLVRLRRMKIWHQRMEELVKARLTSLQGASAEKEYQCKKIVALCTGIPIDKVEEVKLTFFLLSTCVPRYSRSTSDAGELGYCGGERIPNRRHRSSVRIHAKGAGWHYLNQTISVIRIAFVVVCFTYFTY